VTVARTYSRAQNETASRERLMVLLLQAALRHMNSAARAFDEKRNAAAITAVAKAQEIISELLGTLDARQAPELCEHLGALYTFCLGRLLRSMTDRESKPIKEAIRAFSPIADGFAQAVQGIERSAAASPSPAR
jgi:flagellar biosynthetic protein FliS